MGAAVRREETTEAPLSQVQGDSEPLSKSPLVSAVGVPPPDPFTVRLKVELCVAEPAVPVTVSG